ncbi:MAG TPA: YdcF family protein [bacterium]|nr:YdcF family protein [bacterium]
MKSYRLALFLILTCCLFLTTGGCSGDSDDDDDDAADDDAVDDDATDDDSTPVDDDDDDTLDDDVDDDDTVDDDTTDDDTADDDDVPFPELAPDKCEMTEPPDTNGFDPDYEPVDSGRPVQDKNFYLLTLLGHVPAIAAALADDPAIAAVSTARDDALRTAAATCGADPDCYAAAVLWSTEQAEAMAAELVRVLVDAKDDLLVDAHMRPSGLFQFHADETDAEMLTQGWLETIEWANGVFNGYARALDAATLDALVNELCDDHPAAFAFFEPLLEIGYAAMMALGRDEAGRYEPILLGENQAAAAHIAEIDWDDYRFPAMLVPGQGPELDWVEFSPLGQWRCDLAAERYLAGLTPLIVFSGGHVHPDQTPFCESLQMKHYVMDTYDIPEEAILIDPYARHTTTNLRNFARIILRYGIPADRPALINTDFAQAIYITYMLEERCLDELGYLPYRVVKRLSSSNSCYLPNPVSLYAAASDPLDP